MVPENINDQVAIVTGAAQGMGKAVAMLLAQEDARVVLNDVKENVLAVANEIEGIGVIGDVSNEDDVNKLVETTVEHYGTVDILVNNAGILRSTRIDNITKAEWDLVLNVNLNSAFMCTKAVLPIMKEKRFGRIINMSSSAGRSVSTLGGAHYTTSKAGMLGFTRAVAKEVAPFGITVNAVCPGLIDTEMVRLDINPDIVAAYEKSFPIPRLGTPEEVAKLVLFLIADAPYITGASIDINGGDLMM